jgi:hypothetical protein
MHLARHHSPTATRLHFALAALVSLAGSAVPYSLNAPGRH